MAIGTENSVKFVYMRYASGQTDRHADRNTSNPYRGRIKYDVSAPPSQALSTLETHRHICLYRFCFVVARLSLYIRPIGTVVSSVVEHFNYSEATTRTALSDICFVRHS